MLTDISHQEKNSSKKQCQDYEQGLLSGTSTDFDVIAELGAFTKWSTECFGSWFCENANFEAPKNEGKSYGEKQILAQMAKVKGTFCNEIGAGHSIEKAVKSVEDLTKQSINGLKKDLKMQEKIKAIVEQELNKDAQVKGKLMTILNHFKIPSFSVVLEGAFKKLFDQRHEGKCHIPSHQVLMGTDQRRRRKRMDQNGHQKQGQQQQQLALELGVVIPQQQQQQNVPKADAQPIVAKPIQTEAATGAKAALKKFWKKSWGFVIFILCMSLLIFAISVKGPVGIGILITFFFLLLLCLHILTICALYSLSSLIPVMTVPTRVHAVGQPPQTPPPSP